MRFVVVGLSLSLLTLTTLSSCRVDVIIDNPVDAQESTDSGLFPDAGPAVIDADVLTLDAVSADAL